MNNILVLTDFSETSSHATDYAAALTHQFHSKRLILYHAYEVIVPVPEAAVSLMDNGESLRKDSQESLRTWQTKLEGMVYGGTAVISKAEDASLAFTINDLAREMDIDLIVTGLPEKTKLGQILVGSTAIKVADESRYPILIVPYHAALRPIKRILFAIDQKKLPETIPENKIRKLLDVIKAPLIVASVDYREEKSSLEAATSALALQALLDSYQPESYQIGNQLADMATFARKHDISLVMTLHKSRGYFEGIFYSDPTHKLAWSSPAPLLVIP